MRLLWIWLGILGSSIAVSRLPAVSGVQPFWPALIALGTILATRQAALGLGAGVLAGAIVAADGSLLVALQTSFADHLMPQIEARWHVSAIIFTLLLGAFAGVLESSGGFSSILNRMLTGSKNPEKRVLGSVYVLGLLCFFDGLANSMLTGRIARPAADQAGISRERLAWVVDSTSSPVACVAFISTWIATQLTLIGDSLPEADAYSLYFHSIPANPYCLLTLLLIPLAILFRWTPQWMRRYPASPPDSAEASSPHGAPWRVILPLIVLAGSIAASFQIWSGAPIQWTSLETWRAAASSNAGPTALVAGAFAGLITACLCHPRQNEHRWHDAALRGATGMIPALIVLIFAWGLGSVFRTLGAAEAIQNLLGQHVPAAWLPLAVFGVAALTAFTTGSSWGTMALLMPLALGVLVQGSEAALLPTLAPPVIGAVFGGAVFGDHASPFSDTTIVSALASGCQPVHHVISQLPYAATAALSATLAYLLIPSGIPPAAATGCAALGMTAAVYLLAKRSAT
ncbi:MAG: Na+/H+ antiporter NhaC family protein [Verrucomicrobiales bacterium]